MSRHNPDWWPQSGNPRLLILRKICRNFSNVKRIGRQGANYVVFIFGKSAQENLIAEKKMASFTSVKIIDFGFAVDIGDNKGKLIVRPLCIKRFERIKLSFGKVRFHRNILFFKNSVPLLAPTDIDHQNKFNFLPYLIRLTCGHWGVLFLKL